MSASEFRSMAREKLQNKWGNAALIMLVFSLCSIGISFATSFIPFIGGIVNAIITPVLSFGLIKQWIKFKNGENVGYIDFFELGFSEFVMLWKVLLRVVLKLALPIGLILIGGIVITVGSALEVAGAEGSVMVAMIFGIVCMLVGSIWSIPISYKYICVTNELAYDSARSSKEIVEQSGNYMVGNRIGIFCLQLSFIGWTILAMFTCYIGCLWLAPYMQIATILYYESVSGRLNKGNESETVVTWDEPIF